MSRAPRVVCFFEDIAHERFVTALIRRAAEQQNVTPEIKVLNATHGSRVWRELRQYLRELKDGRQPLPDILVVVIDGNCKKAAQVRKDIEREVAKADLAIPHVVCAVPDPHIERWYLEDPHAVKAVFPKAKPRKVAYKCERDYYKRALIETIRTAGIEPLLGGAEYGEDIAKALDVEDIDRSFQLFWKDVCTALKSGNT